MEVHGGLISHFFSCLSIKPLHSIILDSHTCQTNPAAAKMQVSGIKFSHPPLGSEVIHSANSKDLTPFLRRLKWMNSPIIIGIPLSGSGKNIYFDRD
jgi:hypothetical protein